MKKIEEYLEHATQCRALANRGLAHTRQRLYKMAEAWERLATDRKKRIARHKRLAELDAISELNRKD
jgi:hypothetical protein